MEPIASREKEKQTGGHSGVLVLAAVTIAGLVVCILLAAPFLGALTWALTLAILFAPLHARIVNVVAWPNLAAMISVLIVVLAVAGPAIFVVERLIEQAAASVSLIQERLRSGAIQQLLDAQPGIAPVGKWIEQQIDLPAVIANLASWLSNAGAAFARNSAVQVIEFVLTFYMLFYFLRDQTTARRFLTERLPLTTAETERLFTRVVDTIHATVYGTIAVAAIQGILGGLIFSFLGLPTPLLWGLVMGLLSIVPVLGAFIVWIPAAIFLAINGDLGKAAILAVWGAVVVGSIDNILRPIFVGDRLRLHTVPAFISIIGGLVLFGMAGLILGPLAVTITIMLIEIWAERDRTGYPETLE
ncbi:AI-2E family transporter [Aurantimonas marina]|uniref:AI-2E family transporter n=1 Tax=Aurantimonas marina TaxID=2780508 RepID=UPI0019D11D64|nr:AI-2E family transporter [Aurantimonas marina]